MKHLILSIARFPISLFPIALCGLDAAGCASVAQTAAPTSTTTASSHVSLLLGERWLDSSDWSPVDDQFVIGVGFDMPLTAIPAEFEANVFRSKDESGSVEGITREVSAGLRKTFVVGEEKLHPYVGGGLALIRGEVDAPGADDDDTSAAIYLHGGAAYDLAPNWQAGLDLRFLFGSDIDLNGHHGDADYTQLALFVAYGF
jgi:opacity protein-like surface antigen